MSSNYLKKITKNKLLQQLLLCEKVLKTETDEHNIFLFKKWIKEINEELKRREQERLNKIYNK